MEEAPTEDLCARMVRQRHWWLRKQLSAVNIDGRIIMPALNRIPRTSRTAMLPMLFALTIAGLLPTAARAQEIPSETAVPVRNDNPQSIAADEKASCPPTGTIVLPMRSGDFSISTFPGAIVFESGMAIDADGAPNAYGPHDRGLDNLANARHHHRWVALVTDQKGRPVVQKKGRYRGYYVSTTALQASNIHNRSNPAKYVDSTKIPYIVLPPEVASRFDIQLGDLAVVINQKVDPPALAFAIYADVGPRGKIGEGSIALARTLGLPSNPRNGGAEDGIQYVVFPGSGLGQGRLRRPLEINSSAVELYEQWTGAQALQACSSFEGSWSPAAR